MSGTIGANYGAALTSAEAQQSGKTFGLGDRSTSDAGKEYVYVLAGSAITANFFCKIDSAYTADMLSTSNDSYGTLVGVPEAAIASGSYGWLQVKGPATVQVSASCAANVRINTTATAGQLDDDGTALSFPVFGVALTSARAASAGTAPAVLNYPYQGVVL